MSQLGNTPRGVQEGTDGPGGTGTVVGPLSGDVTTPTASSGVTTIGNDKVTNAKLANMVQQTIKGRAVGAGTGDPTDLTTTQARAVLELIPVVQDFRASNGSITFTGLNGDTTTDLCYRLYWNFKFAGAVPTVLLRFNADTGSNYADAYIGTALGTPLVPVSNANGLTGIKLNFGGTGTGLVAGTVDIIQPLSGIKRVCVFDTINQEDTETY